jgi:hypothetical protein
MRLRWHTRVIELMSVYVNIFNFILSTNGSAQFSTLRDRPFNLKGGEGGLWFFVSFRILFSDNTRVRINFFCRAKREFFFQNSTLGYMAKTLNHIIFVFLHQSQNIVFSNIGNQNFFFRKKLSWIILILAIVFA